VPPVDNVTGVELVKPEPVQYLPVEVFWIVSLRLETLNGEVADEVPDQAVE